MQLYKFTYAPLFVLMATYNGIWVEHNIENYFIITIISSPVQMVPNTVNISQDQKFAYYNTYIASYDVIKAFRVGENF